MWRIALLYILSLGLSILTLWYEGGPFLSLAWIVFTPLAGVCSYLAEKLRDSTQPNLFIRGLSVLSISQLIASVLVIPFPVHSAAKAFDSFTYKAYAIFFSLILATIGWAIWYPSLKQSLSRKSPTETR